MTQRAFSVFKVPDSEVINNVINICTQLNLINNTKFNFNLGPDTQPLNSKFNEIKTNKVIQKILNQNKFLIENLSVNVEENPRQLSYFSYTRKNNQPNDTFIVDFNNCPFERAMDVLSAVQSNFILYDPTEDLDKRLGPELADFYRKREQGLLKLENLSQTLITQNEEYRRKIDNQYLDKEAGLKKEYEDLKTKLVSDISKQKEALDIREKELDDRKSTHARRQLRNDIKQELKNRSEKFNLTKTTMRKRWPVHILFALLIIGISTLLIITFTEDIVGQNASKYLEIYHYVRLGILGISLVVTIIFYIHWNDRWAQIHADEEFRLKRLDLDIDRASWIVEMAMEWQAEKKNELPEELLDRLSYNLFSDKESSGITEHPYEELIKMLLTVSAEAKVPIPGGGEIRIDKQGMKSLAKSQA